MEGTEIHIKSVAGKNFAGLKIEPVKALHSWLFVLHGYGGCKEEMLPLSIFLAGRGVPVLTIDLPGHGESGGLFDYTSAVRCIAYWREYMKNNFAAAIGHSIGGRLALSLEFPSNIAISPPLSATFTGGKTEMIRVLRPHRVRESAPFSGLAEILEILGENLPADSNKKGLILFAQHDLPVVKRTAAAAPPDHYELKEIKHSHHHDILTSRQTLDDIWLWLAARVN